LVVYDAWLTQESLVSGKVPSAKEWDWDAIEALFGH
jgi:hypothetical protein